MLLFLCDIIYTNDRCPLDDITTNTNAGSPFYYGLLYVDTSDRRPIDIVIIFVDTNDRRPIDIDLDGDVQRPVVRHYPHVDQVQGQQTHWDLSYLPVRRLPSCRHHE